MRPLPGPGPAAWDALALAARNVFSTHLWASTWWEVLGEGATPHVLCDDERDPTVVLPLVRSGRLLRQLRWLGHGPADRLGPVCAPEHLPRAAALLSDAVADGRLDADVLLLQDGPLARPWWQHLDPALGVPRTISTEVSPVLRFHPDEDWDTWLARRSRNFRSQVGAKSRRLARDHDVSFRLADAATLDADLEHLFRLHLRRWAGDTPLVDERQREHVARFARGALERGWLRLWTLWLGERCAAAALCLRFGPDAYWYQFGRDPELDRESVGFVLLAHVVREARAEGAQEFRFLRGEESYKSRFADEDDPVGTVAVPLGTRGRVAVALAAHRRRDVRVPDPRPSGPGAPSGHGAPPGPPTRR